MSNLITFSFQILGVKIYSNGTLDYFGVSSSNSGGRSNNNKVNSAIGVAFDALDSRVYWTAFRKGRQVSGVAFGGKKS